MYFSKEKVNHQIFYFRRGRDNENWFLERRNFIIKADSKSGGQNSRSVLLSDFEEWSE